MAFSDSLMEMMDRGADARIAGLVVPDGLDGKPLQMMDRNAGATLVGLVVPDGLDGNLMERDAGLGGIMKMMGMKRWCRNPVPGGAPWALLVVGWR